MIPTATEQTIITTVELTSFPALEIANMITLTKNVKIVSITPAKNDTKKR